MQSTQLLKRASFAEDNGVILWDKYVQIFNAIDNGAKKVTIRSANGIGKTKLISTLAAFELKQCLDRNISGEEQYTLAVICTGATATSVKNSLWAECRRSVRPFRDRLDVSDSRIAISDTQFMVRINPGRIEAGQGVHADRVVILIDEASRFTSEMLAALMSNASGDNFLIVLTYNPLDSDSAVYELEQVDKSWAAFSISAFDHPNVISGEEKIVGATSRAFVETQLYANSVQTVASQPGAIHLHWNNTFWEPTAEAMARVCGQWSLALAHGFIPMSEILDCCREDHTVSHGMVCMGLDIAAGGDDATVYTIFHGDEQTAYGQIKTGDFATIAAWVKNITIEHNVELIGIDDTGVGNAVTERLATTAGLSAVVLPINFSSKPKGFEKIRKPYNARAEMYMVLEKEIRSRKIKLLYKQDALKEIAAARIVAMKGTEAVRLEDKMLIKRRLGRSPDHADAVALARYARRLLTFYNQPKLLF